MQAAVLIERHLFEQRVLQVEMAVLSSLREISPEVHHVQQNMTIHVYEALSFYLYHILAGMMGSVNIDYMFREYLERHVALDESRRGPLYNYIGDRFREIANSTTPYLKHPVENHAQQLMDLDDVRFEFTGSRDFAVVVMEFVPSGESVHWGPWATIPQHQGINHRMLMH